MVSVRQQRNVEWAARLRARQDQVASHKGFVVEGVLDRMVGMTLEAVGCQAAVGARCTVLSPDGQQLDAEVVGFANQRLYLMPISDMRGMTPGATVIPTSRVADTPVGDQLLGRVLDGSGKPLDSKGPLDFDDRVPLTGIPINPLKRVPIREPLDVGIRSINGLFTVARGQRMGLFAGSGVGKSVLLGMMTRHTNADVAVVGLIGERGREVKEFVETTLGEDGLRRAVVIAAPADQPPLMRMHAAWTATAVAEYFRDRGKKVLLLMDSLTRFAQAQREIALAIGEPPATKGYPPSVFSRLPQLVERAGNGDHGQGSITAFYTVLVEGDDQNDPIADAARAILDGHIVLSRGLADAGIYPAIDTEASISRAMHSISAPDYLENVQRFRQLYASYQQNRDLITVGAYKQGSDPRIDDAIAYLPGMLGFLQQNMHQRVDLSSSQADLQRLINHPPAALNQENGLIVDASGSSDDAVGEAPA